MARARYQGPRPLPAVLLASRGRTPATIERRRRGVFHCRSQSQPHSWPFRDVAGLSHTGPHISARRLSPSASVCNGRSDSARKIGELGIGRLLQYGPPSADACRLIPAPRRSSSAARNCVGPKRSYRSPMNSTQPDCRKARPHKSTTKNNTIDSLSH